MRRLRRGHRACNALKQLIGRLDDTPVLVAPEIAALKDRPRIVRPRGRCRGRTTRKHLHNLRLNIRTVKRSAKIFFGSTRNFSARSTIRLSPESG
jgi:hypothetical protein